MPEEKLQVPAVCEGICIPLTGLQLEVDESRWKGVGVMFTPTSCSAQVRMQVRDEVEHTLAVNPPSQLPAPPTRSQILAWVSR